MLMSRIIRSLVQLRNNQLEGLPDSFADLTALSSLDLSHNHLKSLPHNFWALPSLAILNLSHNSLSALPFNSPFEEGTNPLDRTSDPRGEWYSETITRATKPLPKLTSLDVSHNIIPASAIPHDVNHYPALLNKLDLSFNPLGNCIPVFRALSKLVTLQELKFEHAAIADDSFPVSLFTDDETTSSSTRRFPLLTTLDLGETHASRPVIESVFLPPFIKQTLDFDVTSDPPKDGTIRIFHLDHEISWQSWVSCAFPHGTSRMQGQSCTHGVPKPFFGVVFLHAPRHVDHCGVLRFLSILDIVGNRHKRFKHELDRVVFIRVQLCGSENYFSFPGKPRVSSSRHGRHDGTMNNHWGAEIKRKVCMWL